MKKLILLCCFCLLPATVKANPYNWPVSRVIDGDTLECKVDFLPAELGDKLSIRILGIDTPEKGSRAKCPKEAALAKRASSETALLVAHGKKIDIYLKQWDKFGGRVNGAVKIDGVDLGAHLIGLGLARPYFGKTKSSWCE